jgi:hypothetical protein
MQLRLVGDRLFDRVTLSVVFRSLAFLVARITRGACGSFRPRNEAPR